MTEGSDVPGSSVRANQVKSSRQNSLYQFRRATEHDFPAIKALIREVQINPMGLHWQNFLIAVDSQGRLIGCGQINAHQDGSYELASIAVVPDWRRVGIASQMILQLLESHPETLYLTCRAELGTFYQRFGFSVIDLDEMPPYFRRISRIVSFIRKSGLLQEGLLVMRRVI